MSRTPRRTFLVASVQGAAGLALRAAPAVGEQNLDTHEPITGMVPRDPAGRRFLFYSDCCSGIPGGALEKTHAAINAMVARMRPLPEFIAFPGDAVAGYTTDLDELRRQWQYWTETEMKWVAGTGIPLYQSTSNHHTYDFPSEQVFREVHAHLPQNGRGDERGLAYAVRNGNLVYISTHQPDRTRPYRREMQIDTEWLDAMLTELADAQFKLVAGHYPVYPVNGYGLAPQWCFRENEREAFRLIPQAGFGQQAWRGPRLPEEGTFDVSIALHPGLGPGGVLSRSGDSPAWSSCFSSSSKGVDDLAWPSLWTLGHGPNGPDSEPFCGRDLMITASRQVLLEVDHDTVHFRQISLDGETLDESRMAK